ncbi:hypothetical protein JCM24511_01925 [Saitozyma sp. JCM 24511]|nr:hypothetical protein JCM24511_01925 [Saitozyma sp. JCM 24511]
MSSTITVSGKPCGRIGYGLLGLTALAAPQRPTEEAAIEAIKAAVDAGANLLNSATFYGVEDPLANLKLLNRFFETYPDYVNKTVVVVKGGLKNYQLITDFDALREDAKTAQAALGTKKKIDIFEYARLPDDIPIEEVMRRMMTLRDEGLFNHIGFSEISGPTLRRAANVGPVAAVEIELSLWAMEPAILETVAVTKELGIPFQAYSPLGRGILTGKWKSPDDMDKDDRRRMWPRFQGENFAKNLELVEKVARLAEKKGVTNSQLALAYILRMSPMVLPIPGSSSPERILSNIAAQDVQLTDAEVKEIDDVLASFTVSGDRYPQQFMKDLVSYGRLDAK